MLECYFNGCLYFTVSKLSRIITRMAEEEFMKTGLSPTYGFLLMAVNERQGISQNELCEILHVAPSTLTRFIDKLEGKGLVTRRLEGKNSLIHTTDKGKELEQVIEKAWKDLYDRYTEVLGEKDANELAASVHNAVEKLEGK